MSRTNPAGFGPRPFKSTIDNRQSEMQARESAPIAVLSDISFEERPGGSERLAVLACEALARRGRAIEAVAGSSGGPATWQNGAIGHRRFPVRTRHHTVQCWDAWKGAVRWARGARPTTVVAFHPSSALGCIQGGGGRFAVAQFFFAPTYREWLYSSRGAINGGPARFLVARAIREVQARALRASDMVLVLGEYSRELLLQTYPGIARVEELSPGVDTERYSFRPSTKGTRESLGLDPDETILLTVRRLVPRTGVLGLVDAFARLSGPGRRLLIVGEGPLRFRIQQRIRRLGLGDRVKLLGRVPDEDLMRYYQAADLSVVPSVSFEAFGLVVLESMSCGTPAATTPVGGAPEIVAKVNRGLVLPGTSPRDVASGLQLLLDRYDLEALRPRSRDLVESRYSLDRMGERLVSLLESLR
jgi:glycosyltransferase involved in cell wall biosynthesis